MFDAETNESVFGPEPSRASKRQLPPGPFRRAPDPKGGAREASWRGGRAMLAVGQRWWYETVANRRYRTAARRAGL